MHAFTGMIIIINANIVHKHHAEAPPDVPRRIARHSAPRLLVSDLGSKTHLAARRSLLLAVLAYGEIKH
jgi:hypothetical protein